MDEWDEFLARSTTCTDIEDVIDADTEMDVVSTKEHVTEVSNPRDLGDFGDNAEVLMQMARGESLNSLSSNGVWINSTAVQVDRSNTANASTFPVNKKRAFKPLVAGPSVPVANSIQDLTRSITGHPVLSYPLSLLKQLQNQQVIPDAYEIDSLGLFFYGAAGDVKVECSARDDMMKVIEMKKNLLGKSIISDDLGSYTTVNNNDQLRDCGMIVSHDNLKLLANSIPPAGKSSWIIPFTVNAVGTIDLSSNSLTKPDTLTAFYDYCSQSVKKQMAGLMEPSEHSISLGELSILIKTQSPAFNISVQYRGTGHVDQSAESTNFLFYRQSNYSVEIDFEGLRIQAIKSFVPKFDQQNRLFLLLKALNSKLSCLPEGQYLLAHPSNTPFIKILAFTPHGDAINIFESFLK